MSKACIKNQRHFEVVQNAFKQIESCNYCLTSKKHYIEKVFCTTLIIQPSAMPKRKLMENLNQCKVTSFL